jgi:hypothetical protein
MDEELRILRLRLFSLDPDMARELEAQLIPIIQTPRPLHILINLGNFDFGELMNQAQSEEIPMPDVSHHEEHSSLAIVTTKPGIKMLLDTVNRLAGREEAIRAFKYEDEALVWLEERARAAD